MTDPLFHVIIRSYLVDNHPLLFRSSLIIEILHFLGRSCFFRVTQNTTIFVTCAIDMKRMLKKYFKDSCMIEFVALKKPHILFLYFQGIWFVALGVVLTNNC